MTTPEQKKAENMEKMRAGIKGMENQIVGLKAQIAKKKAALDEMEKQDSIQEKLDMVGRRLGIKLDKKSYTPSDVLELVTKIQVWCDQHYVLRQGNPYWFSPTYSR